MPKYDKLIGHEFKLQKSWLNLQVYIAMEKAIRHKFPNIKNLQISEGEITFDDDGIHTKRMIEDFIAEIKTTRPNPPSTSRPPSS